MVDLVKIRKKAKENKEANGSEPQESAPVKTPAATPAAEAPADPKPQKSAKAKTPPAAKAAHGEPAAAPSKASAPPPADPVAPRPPAAKPEQAEAQSVERHDSRPATPVPQPAIAAAPSAAVEAATPADPRSISKLEKFKQRAGRLRDDADHLGLARGGEQAAAESSGLEVLTFAIAGEHYAVDIEHIVEIVHPRTPTRVPNADPSIVGILSLRGTIVTLIDVRRRLRHTRSGVTPETRIVVVDHRGETIGFEVDQVFRVVKIAESDVSPHPVVHASELDESIRGVFRQADALTILLDFDKLLDRRENPRNGAAESAASPV